MKVVSTTDIHTLNITGKRIKAERKVMLTQGCFVGCRMNFAKKIAAAAMTDGG